MAISTPRFHAPTGGSIFGPFLARTLRSILIILHILFLTLLAVVLLSQLLQALKCDNAPAFTCLRAQDALLLLNFVLSGALAAAAVSDCSFWRIRNGAEIGWALLFTWYAWFSLESPFRVHELNASVGVAGLSIGEILISYGVRLCLYFVLVFLGVYPLLDGKYIERCSRPRIR
jgi:hypothetical protein